MSPIRWETMSPEEQQVWKDYRQALLDITEQPGWPWNITWPLHPSELDK